MNKISHIVFVDGIFLCESGTNHCTFADCFDEAFLYLSRKFGKVLDLLICEDKMTAADIQDGAGVCSSLLPEGVRGLPGKICTR